MDLKPIDTRPEWTVEDNRKECDRIVAIFEKHGMLCTPQQACYLWLAISIDYMCSWRALPDSDEELWEGFFKDYEGEFWNPTEDSRRWYV